MADAGWLDLTHVRTSVKVGDVAVALAGTTTPICGRARYRAHCRAGRRASAPCGSACLHSPEPALLARFAADGYDLVLAGHTHGGQVRVPFGPAIVTNCGIDVHRARWLHQWDDQMWFHVCAGLGTNPFTPIRFALPPRGVAADARAARSDRALTGPAPVCWPVALSVLARSGVWRSLVARFVRDEEAAGSNPATPTQRFRAFQRWRGPFLDPNHPCQQ